VRTRECDSHKTDEIRFGYWARKLELQFGGALIRPIANFEVVVQSMKQHERVANGWLYPPLVSGRDRRNASSGETIVYQRVFGVNATHCLCLPRTLHARALGEFLIALLGMLEGLRLIPEKWVHFYRAAVKPHTLSDVYCDRADLEQVLTIGQTFWKAKNARIKRLMFGAIHWRVFSESYEHEFERFSGQYTVLDTCWKMYQLLEPTAPKRLAHARRPKWLAKQYGLRLPSWAKIRNGRSAVATLRNGFFHEGLYGNGPIGFDYPKGFSGSIDFELAAFNTRLILAMLGVRSEYVRSSVQTRSQFLMGLE
jgi:hypothetical protein